MKNFILIFALLLFAFSCRNDSAETQKIDQAVHLYIKDATGKDLLNSKLPNTYTEVKMFDLNDKYDLVAMNSFSLKKDADTVNYIEYIAGGKRILKDSLNANQKTYQSDFIINLNKMVNSKPITDSDTIRFVYFWTPTLFQISKAYYNQKQVFVKTSQTTNIISVVK